MATSVTVSKATKPAVKHSKKVQETYNLYLYKVLKQVHPDMGISAQAMAIMNSFVRDMFERIVNEAANLTTIDRKSTLDARSVQTATQLQIPKELAKHGIAEGMKSVNKYHANMSGDDKKKRKSQSERAGLQFPVGRIARYMKEGSYAKRIGGGAPVYLASVLEYLSAELLETAGNAAKDNKKARIIPRHIMLAIKNDDEFDKLLPLVIVCQAGVRPNIAPQILPYKFKTRKPALSSSMAY